VIELARAEYETLPEDIQALYTYTQWMWLSGEEKARVVQAETEPEQYDG
jgi:hypothetical protein